MKMPGKNAEIIDGVLVTKEITIEGAAYTDG